MMHKWKTFFAACFRKRFLYDAVLPYNLFWRITGEQCQPFLRNHPIEVLDVGCRGECPPELAGLSPCISYTGLEADIDECTRLQKSRLPFARASFLPFAVSGRAGKALLRVNREPGTSSFLPVDPMFRERFGGEAYETLKTRVLRTTTLDNLAKLKHVPQPDFLKIDTQGTELQILAGGRRMLQKVSLVEIEVEFEAIYQGQSLFHHVNDFMLQAGAKLYIDRGKSKRRKIPEEERIIDWLKTQGFEVIDCGKMSVKDQAAAFAHAELIVAPHGGALTNLIFCRPGTKIIELLSSEYPNPCYRDLCCVAKLPYIGIIGNSQKPKTTSDLSDSSGPIETTLEDFKKAFEQMSLG